MSKGGGSDHDDDDDDDDDDDEVSEVSEVAAIAAADVVAKTRMRRREKGSGRAAASLLRLAGRLMRSESSAAAADLIDILPTNTNNEKVNAAIRTSRTLVSLLSNPSDEFDFDAAMAETKEALESSSSSSSSSNDSVGATGFYQLHMLALGILRRRQRGKNKGNPVEALSQAMMSCKDEMPATVRLLAHELTATMLLRCELCDAAQIMCMLWKSSQEQPQEPLDGRLYFLTALYFNLVTGRQLADLGPAVRSADEAKDPELSFFLRLAALRADTISQDGVQVPPAEQVARLAHEYDRVFGPSGVSTLPEGMHTICSVITGELRGPPLYARFEELDNWPSLLADVFMLAAAREENAESSINFLKHALQRSASLRAPVLQIAALRGVMSNPNRDPSSNRMSKVADYHARRVKDVRQAVAKARASESHALLCGYFGVIDQNDSDEKEE